MSDEFPSGEAEKAIEVVALAAKTAPEDADAEGIVSVAHASLRGDIKPGAQWALRATGGEP